VDAGGDYQVEAGGAVALVRGSGLGVLHSGDTPGPEWRRVSDQGDNQPHHFRRPGARSSSDYEARRRANPSSRLAEWTLPRGVALTVVAEMRAPEGDYTLEVEVQYPAR